MAGEKKKLKNKQNFVPLKKPTIQQINNTQQIACPLYKTLDVKNINRSIQLKKQVTNKKSVSRKSGCVSAKPVCSSVKATSQTLPGVKYKQLLKKFDELKGIQQRVERSKSRSMKQIREKQKSRSPKMKSSNSKKFNLTQLINKHPGTKIHYYTTTNNKTEFNSRMSLTNKLQKTLTKINQNDYFDKSQDNSLIPFISTSQPYNNDQTHTILNSRCFQMSVQEVDDQDINIGEMRKFCRTVQNEELFESSIKRDIGYFRGDRYEMMATRIQRAWRRYCTKRLVDRYADVFIGEYVQRSTHNRPYMVRQEMQHSSSSELQYYEQKYHNYRKDKQKRDNKNEKDAFQLKKDENNYLQQDIELNGRIRRITDEDLKQFSQQSIQSQQIDQNVNDRTYSDINQQGDLDNQDQHQQEVVVNYEENSDENEEEINRLVDQNTGNVLSSSLLYPMDNPNDRSQRLVTFISNLDDSNEEQNETDIDLTKMKQNQLQQNKQFKTIKPKPKQQPQPKQISRPTSKSYTQLSPQQSDFIINQVKQNELHKWNEVVQMLKQNQNKSHSEKEKLSLISQIQQKSTSNKKELQNSQHAKINKDNQSESQKIEQPKYKKQQQQTKPAQQQLLPQAPKRQSSGPSSQLSDVKRQEQFDSRKYIEYLDSDMYYEYDKEKSSQNSQPQSKQQILNKRISLKKQKQLLTMLDFAQPPLIKRKEFGHTVSKSQNLTYLINQNEKQQRFPEHPIITKHRLVKSMSEKNIEVAIRSISPHLQYANEPDELNLQLIRQQFLQGGDTIMEFQKLHTSQQLRMKIKQTLKNTNQIMNQSSSQDEPTQPIIRVSIDLSKTFGLNNNADQQPLQLQKTHGLPLTKNTQASNFTLEKQSSIYQPQKHPINIQPTTLQTSKVFVENIEKYISSDQEDNQTLQNEKEKQQKMENVSFMVYNTMILQVLRQIASYDPVLEKFKQYSLTVKQAIKQSKKGFQTNHTEVKSYVDGLISYLLNQEPQVFKNLEVPAGPTALQMLHYMHPNEEDEMDEGSSVSQDETSVLVIPNRIFDKYWNIRQKSLKYDIQSAPHINPQRKKKIVQQLKNLTKMFYRSIFDTFNQCLDIERNYGQAGKPYPWKKIALFEHTKTLEQIQKSISSAQKRMTEIGTTYCGLIIQKNEMARITLEGSDDYIQHVQEDRMSRMLAQDLIEGEERWTFYDDQQLQLLVQIGNFIVISLIMQATGQVCQLLSTRNQ